MIIKLENVNIKYKNIIIKNGKIEIPSGEIVSIIGESGTGKTSLLYLLGLISSNRDYQYFYKGQLLEWEDTEAINQFRRKKIGFLFQDNSLIENLTIAENIRFAVILSGQDITEKEIEEHLSFVGLEDKGDQYPLQLSGGELQRAAIAGLVAKKTEIILADEPTSALDQTNEQRIMDLFAELSKSGITVVIATHNPQIYNQSNRIYKIENKEIIQIKEDVLPPSFSAEKDKTEKGDGKKVSLGVPPLFWYARKAIRKKRVLKTLMIVFCAIAIAGFTLTSELAKSLNANQANLLNQISYREIFLVNQTVPSSMIKDCDENLSVTEESYQKIREISTIKEIYPYFEFRSFSLHPENRRLGTEVHLTSDTRTVSIPFSLEANPQTYFVIVPYNENLNFDRQLSKSYASAAFPENGIYLSYSMAEKLGLQGDEKTLSLDFEIGVPTYNYMDVFTSNNSTEVQADLDFLTFTEVELEIAGILEPSIVNRYSIAGENIIYLPYKMMEDILYSEKLIAEPPVSFTVKEWAPSAYLIYVNHYNEVELTQKKLQNIDSNFIARSDYQDTAKMDSMLQDIKQATSAVIAVLLFILFILMSGIFISDTFGRKREFALLKANGMKKSEFIRLIVIESFIQSLKIMLIAASLILVLSLALNHLVFGTSMIVPNWTIAGLTLLISLSFVLVPTFVSVLFATRLQPDKVLRN